MRLRSTTEWTTRAGKKRTIRLYKAWRNICGRVQGHNVDGQGNKRWEGIGNEFINWQHFREWSLVNGYCKEKNSCDRIRSCESYSPNNCRWVSIADNTIAACETRKLNEAIVAFQLSAPTEEEIAEAKEFDRLCLGIYH